MLNKLKKTKLESSNRGFTIIEVMIVLAIAALILLIVFLAVPALQRSARNTQRKTDIGRFGAAATTVIDNNNGTIPTPGSTFASAVYAEAGTLSYYTTASEVTAQVLTNVSTPVSNPTTTDTVVIVGNGQCTAGKASFLNRGIAILYSVETGSTSAPICVDE